MKLGELLILLTFFGIGSSLIVYSFNDYLIARSIGPNNTDVITVKSGQPLKINIDNSPTGQIAISLCNETPSGPNCLPLAVVPSAPSITVRMPIGYQPGPARLEVSRVAKPYNQELFTIQLTIE